MCFGKRPPSTGALLAVVLSFATLAACERAEVDSRLVGAWQLERAGAPIYWTIHGDGTYRISGLGAGAGETGTFAAADGRWSIESPSRGADGGTYELPSEDVFFGTGSLGPAVWRRVGASAAEPPAFPAAAQPAGALPAAVQPADELPSNVPALLFDATQLAREWRTDAIPVSLEYEYVQAPNRSGADVRVLFVSPADGTGMRATLRDGEWRTSRVEQQVTWGTLSLPPAFVDLPAAVREARDHGFTGALRRARLAVHAPNGAHDHRAGRRRGRVRNFQLRRRCRARSAARRNGAAHHARDETGSRASGLAAARRARTRGRRPARRFGAGADE